MNYMNIINNAKCECGKVHSSLIDECISEKGAINKLPAIIKKYNCTKAFIVADINTYDAAGKSVCSILKNSNINYSSYIYNSKNLEPNETAVGSVVMHFDKECDVVIGVGSGVINDISKILADVTNSTYIVVATAPSMDGYASATSSVTRDGLKISLNSKCANVVIGDIDILKNAPLHMLKSGLGDMIAKYVSICEWRISNIITGEYYCEKVAELIRSALKRCVDNADKLLERNEDAVQAVFEGLVLGGVAMNFAGLSRPASGVEHYFSHVWDMRGEEFHTPVDLHGIQCAIGTLMSLKIYETIKEVTPNKEKAFNYVENFNYDNWKTTLSSFLGKASEAMIAIEEKEQKYNVEKHKDRFEIICNNWDKILKIIDEELPKSKDIEALLDKIEAPKSPCQIGIDEKDNITAFMATKDIRDKYVLSRLAWDLGIIEDIII